jgi:protein CrcB
MAKLDTAYLVFDIESVADGALVSRLKYPGENLSPAAAIAKYREELLKESGKDFIPYTYQLPVSLVIAKVARDFSLLDLVALDEKEARPHEIVKNFWQGWQKYNRPTLVTFNGRGFDLPLLELCAFRYGLQIADWFAEDARSFDQPRYRYNMSAHLDLHEWLTNSGASRFNGGLSLAANLIGGYLIGVCVGLFQNFPQLDPTWRLLWVTGFLGALTTFSTFSAEVVGMLQQGRLVLALGTAVLHLIGSLLLTFAGLITVRVLAGNSLS